MLFYTQYIDSFLQIFEVLYLKFIFIFFIVSPVFSLSLCIKDYFSVLFM